MAFERLAARAATTWRFIRSGLVRSIRKGYQGIARLISHLPRYMQARGILASKEAIWAFLVSPGVMTRARRELWMQLRSNPGIRAEMPGGWAPPHLAWVRCAPGHVVIFAAVAGIVGMIVFIFGTLGNGLICKADQAGHCTERLNSIAGTVLAAQVTLLAVVFPIAVALVSVLGSSALRKRSRLWLLFEETEVFVAGTSGVLLSLLCIIFLGFSPTLTPHLAAAAAIICTAWFAFNLLGVGVFLSRSVRFLLDERSALRRQLASRIWPREAEPRLADAILFQHLRPDDETRSTRFEMWWSGKIPNNNASALMHAAIAKPLSRPGYLADIHLGVLAAVEKGLNARASGATLPLIAFGAPIDHSIHTRHEGTVRVAVSRTPLTAVEVWLIRRAYRFRVRRPNDTMPTGERLLGELVSDALEELRSGNDASFRDRCQTIADTHGFLLRIANRRTGDRRFSYATELSSNGFLTLAGSWRRQLTPLCDEATAALPSRLRAFEAVAYLPIKVSHECGPHVAPSALGVTDGFLAEIAYRLFDRGLVAAGDQGVTVGIARKPVVLPADAQRWYDEAWVLLSGAWMRLSEIRWPTPPEASAADKRWSVLIEHTQPLVSHLSSTADLVGKAAATGDLVGGVRALDLLLRWPKAWETRRNTTFAYSQVRKGISPRNLTEAEWDRVVADVNGLAPALDPTPEGIFSAAFRAKWRAECIDLLLVLSAWAYAAGPESPAAMLAAKLIRGQLSDPAQRGEPSTSSSDMLESRTFLQDIANGHSGGWQSTGPLNHDRLRRLQQLVATRSVAGVPYLTSEGIPATTYRREIVTVLVVLSVRSPPGTQWPTHASAIGLPNANSSDADLAQFFEELAKETDTLDGDEVLALLRGLAADQNLDLKRIAAARKRVRIHSRLLARDLRRRRHVAIAQAPIDPTRLSAIAEAAESHAFDLVTAGPPVCLFTQVRRVSGTLPYPIELRMRHERGSLTIPLLQQPVGNEVSWWGETMRDHVAGAIMRELTRRAGARIIVESPEEWRDKLAAGLAGLGTPKAPPILVFGHDWPFRFDREDDLATAMFDRLAGTGHNEWTQVRTPFLDSVNIARVPVHGPTLVAPADMFKELRFQQSPDGRMVAVHFVPDTAKQTNGLLTATSGFELVLDRPERAFVIEARTQTE